MKKSTTTLVWMSVGLMLCQHALGDSPKKGVIMPANVKAAFEQMSITYNQGGLARVLDQRRQLRKSGLISIQNEVQMSNNVKIPLILGKYSNSSNVYPQSDLNNVLFGNNPTGNMIQFYSEISYGQFSLSGNTFGWFGVPQTQANYVGSDQGMHGGGARFARDLVAEADATVDYSQFDSDGDGYVDVAMIVHTGGGAEGGANNNIWSHRWSFNDAHRAYPTVMPDGEYVTNDPWPGHPGQFIKVNDYIIQPELSSSGRIIEIGVFCHEFGHGLGLPDLYDTDNSSEGVGSWCLMAAGSWGGDGSSPEKPTHMSAWCKEQLGWISPTVVTGDQFAKQIINVEQNKVIYKVWTNGSPKSEYYLIENRQQTGFDGKIPASGLLIWHIDNSKTSNQNESHYKVALEQADGRRDLENKQNRGDSGDPYPGSTVNRTFDANSNPSSRDYSNSDTKVAVLNIQKSGLNIIADLKVGSSPLQYTFTVYNDGDAVLSVDSVTSDRNWLSCNQNSFAVAVGGNQQVSFAIDWSLVNGNGDLGQLKLSSNDAYGNNSTSVMIAANKPSASVTISVEPPSWNFGNVSMSTPSEKMFTIINSTSSNATLIVGDQTSTNVNDFPIKSGGGVFSLGPGQSHQTTVGFAPTTSGAKNGILRIGNNSDNAPTVEVPILGTAVGTIVTKTFSVIPDASWDFGTVPVGSSSDRVFQLTNSGNSALVVSVLLLGGTGASQFALIGAPALPLNIAPGQTQNLPLRFSPSLVGTQAANLTITNNSDNDPSKVVALGGNGVASELPSTWSLISNTGSTHSVTLPAAIGPSIEGAPMMNGDYIGVFTPAGICCGVGKWLSQDLALSVWGDNDQTPAKDGFTVGEELRFRAWKKSAGKEYSVIVQFSSGPTTYQISGVSVLAIFRTVVNSPSAPVLALPADGSTGVPITTTISWNAVTGAVTYRVQVSTSPDFGTLLLDDSTVTGTSRPIGPLANAVMYYWRVSATNSGGSSPFAQAFSFATIVAAPLAPILSSPADAATSVPITPSLIWDAVAGASTYRVQVSTSQAFASTVFDDSTVAATTVVIGPLANNTMHFWRVNAKNVGGTSPFATVFSFTTVVALPAAPTLSFPTDSAINIPLNTTLSWIVVAGAMAYHLQVSLTTSFSGNAVDDTTITVPTKAIGPLSLASRYYWRVRAKNLGGWGGYSSLRQFSTIRTTSVEQLNNSIPTEFALGQNYPNPFNPSTTILFALPKSVRVSLKIFSVLGKEVQNLVTQELSPGNYMVRWHADVPSGTYIYRLQAGEFMESKRMLLLR